MVTTILDDILDMMDDMLDSASSVPFSVKKSIIDADKMRDCINEIRLNLPQEMKNAKLIVHDRDSIINEAKKEAEGIIRRAEDRAKVMVSNDEITKAAKVRATEMINQANAKSKEIKAAANKYMDDSLVKVEESMQACLSNIRNTRQTLKAAPIGSNSQNQK